MVVLSMAWQTHQDPDLFHRDPTEPDLETLVYWVQRLEPLIRADSEEEVIVVFCNRTGAEDEAVYTGTSTVIGIKRGEVFVYGILGRGVNDLLIVDTSHPPMSKLTDADPVEADKHVAERAPLKTETESRQIHIVPEDTSRGENGVRPCGLAGHGPEAELDSPRQPTSPRLPWLAQSAQPGNTPTDTRSPTRLQIPTRPQFDEYMPIDSALTDDVIIDTPAIEDTPGLARRPFRPKLAIPASPWRFPNSKASPYPWHHRDGPQSSVFGGGAAMTPITPFDEDGWSSTPIDPKAPARWFWRHEPALSALKESIVEEDEEEGENGPSEAPKEKGKQQVSPIESQQTPDREALKEQADRQEADAPQEGEPETSPLNNDWADLAEVLDGLRAGRRRGSAFDSISSAAGRPCSPKSHNLSRNTSPFRFFQPSELSYGDWDATASDALDSDACGLASTTAWQDNLGHRNDDSSHMIARQTTSRAGYGVFEAGRRRPSRLRHAILPDEEDDEELDYDYDYDSEPDHQQQQHLADHRPRSVSRGRQPMPREISPDRQIQTQTTSTEQTPRAHRWAYAEDSNNGLPAEHSTTTAPSPRNNRNQPPQGEQGLLAALSLETNPWQQRHEQDEQEKEEEVSAKARRMMRRQRLREEEEHPAPPPPRPLPVVEDDNNDTAVIAVESIAATSTTTPSLCSATSAASVTSVSTFDDGDDLGPGRGELAMARCGGGGGGGGGYMEKGPVALREYGTEQAVVAFSFSENKVGTDESSSPSPWFGRETRETGSGAM